MNRIAHFEKVSLGQFTADAKKCFSKLTDEDCRELYDNIRLPIRATSGSAGYDFFIPLTVSLEPNETVTIPTGIRAAIDEGLFLMCCPRSGLGFKYRLRLNNTVGIIDSDYYFADNEGHIHIKLTNESNEEKIIHMDAGSAFAQGIFIPFGITTDDCAKAERTGGFGSTSK
ncbi:MAG: deoxyuridine 5'-triphosphate nucleotidohydrolase [Oscillospiraceae bacterium]|nr:deoxyuridine 5'-triphosphate nucleotidohydrolase [Oscillospiraceae bacterium]